MALYAIIPVKKLDTGKLRLSGMLDEERRRKLSICMLQDVLKTVAAAGEVSKTVVVSPDPKVLSLVGEMGVTPLKEEAQKGVNSAVNIANEFCLNRGASSTLVLPADIPLIQPRDIRSIVEAAKPERSVAITPSMRMDGTNALLRRPPDVIQTSYDRESYQRHLKYAFEKGVHLKVIKSKTVMLDLDTPEDIKEFMNRESNTETYRYLSRIRPADT